MLNQIISYSLNKKWLVLLASAATLVYGVFTAMHIPIDVFPDFAPVQVVIQTEAPGYAPEEVEAQVTLPIEAMVNGTPKVKLVRSISTIGLSVVTMIFEDGTNQLTARQLVAERLQLANNELPDSVKQPMLMPMSTAVGDILKIGLISKTTSLMELRTLSDWTIRRQLMSVPGVSNVVIHGGDLKQYQVLVDPQLLKQHAVTFQQVVDAARASNGNAAGGFLRNSDEEFLIRGIGRIKSTEELGDAVVTSRNGQPVYLRNVADIKIGPAYKIGDAVVNGTRGIVFSITKHPWANTLLTTYAVERTLASLKAGLPSDVQVVTTFRQADFIEVAVRNMLEALALGGILVLAVLFIFLQNWRTVLISLTAIPLSLLAAVITLSWTGGTINTMTLGGLAIAIGEVVDDAIIDVENVYKRLREARASGIAFNPFLVIFDACREVRSSVVYATVIVALVFAPVFALSGLEGRIFAPLGFAYIAAILASLVVALTVTPAMCFILLADAKHLGADEGRLVKYLKIGYRRCLEKTLQHPVLTIVSAGVLLVVSISPFFFLGKQFLPEFDEANLIVAANSMPGTSLDLTVKVGETLSSHLIKHKNVLAVDQRAGRAAGSDDYGVSNFSEYDISLAGHDMRARHDLFEHVRADFAKVPGLVVNMGSYISHRMDHVLSGTNAAIAIKIFGSDLDVLHRTALKVEQLAREVEGAVDVQVEPIVPIPQIAIRIDRQNAARYGLKVDDLSKAIEAAFNGVAVSKVIEAQRSFDLFVWYKPEYRSNLQAIKETLIDTPAGQKVPISALASAEFGKCPNQIRHENTSRYVVVQANVSGRSLGAVIADMKEKLDKQIHLPTGYYINYGGQFQAQEEASQRLYSLSAIVIVGIFFLLWMAFRSPKAAVLVLANLPFALIGGVWAIVLAGGVLSIGSLIGFITLFGISTRNGIMLVTHYNHLFAQGVSFDKVLVQGAMDRLSPVLMTALTASIGVLPIAILGGSGRELEQPLAVVILGGMVSSTVLTLLVFPSIFSLFGRGAIPGWKLEHDALNVEQNT